MEDNLEKLFEMLNEETIKMQEENSKLDEQIRINNQKIDKYTHVINALGEAGFGNKRNDTDEIRAKFREDYSVK